MAGLATCLTAGFFAYVVSAEDEVLPYFAIFILVFAVYGLIFTYRPVHVLLIAFGVMLAWFSYRNLAGTDWDHVGMVAGLTIVIRYFTEGPTK
jgi:uncharacterized membrane protein (UPF0136 family)